MDRFDRMAEGADVTLRASRSLLEELRSTAGARREQLGRSLVPALEPAHEALWRTRAEPTPELRPDLRGLSDLGGVALHSHRRVTGGVVLGVKRLLGRLLTAELGRQSRFNDEAARALAALERRSGAALRALSARLDRAEAGAAGVAARLAPAPRVFDYAGFEATFRGASAELRASLDEVVEILVARRAAPVLDLGCGRGDLLERLREQRLEGRGVDLDRAAVAAARARGLDVAEGDLLDGLRGCPDASLGAVVSIQVVEHLALEGLLALLATASRKLRPGGLLVLETVNVSSGYALTHGWSIDPTHRQRVHPQVLAALARRAGFESVEVRFAGAVGVRDRLEADASFSRLDWLFAPQDVRLVARLGALV